MTEPAPTPPDGPRPVTCPHCSKSFGMENIASYIDNTKVRVTVKPHAGTIMTTEDIGNTVLHFGKLQKAVAKELGANVVCVVPAMALEADGTFWFDVKIGRVVGKRAPRRKK